MAVMSPDPLEWAWDLLEKAGYPEAALEAREAYVSALAASRQPVSGGLEGDEAGWELYRCANGHEFAIRAETATGHVVKCAACGTITVTTEGFGAVAALSRVPAAPSGAIAHRDALRAERGYVPADGEQPAETRCWTIYECPTHGLVPRATVDFDSQPPYSAYHKECQEFVEKIEVAPADGPVSASRPPEEGVSDYKAGELEGFKAGLAKRDEQIKTGTLPAGLGDRQLTDEILKVAHDRRFSNEFLGNLVRAWLASGENPEPYQCDECRCPPNCACCDAKRGCTCKDEPVGGGPFGA